jgi:hypothetical protein
MTEVLTPEGATVNPAEAPAPDKASKDRFVYVDDAAKAERVKRADEGTNATLSASINPLVMQAIAERAYQTESNRDTNNGRPGLKDGTIVDLIRGWAANYAGDLLEEGTPLVISKQKTSNASVNAVNNFKSATLMVFRSARGMVDAFGIPEDQVKSQQFAKVKESAALMLKDIPNALADISDEALQDLWNQASAA